MLYKCIFHRARFVGKIEMLSIIVISNLSSWCFCSKCNYKYRWAVISGNGFNTRISFLFAAYWLWRSGGSFFCYMPYLPCIVHSFLFPFWLEIRREFSICWNEFVNCCERGRGWKVLNNSIMRWDFNADFTVFFTWIFLYNHRSCFWWPRHEFFRLGLLLNIKYISVLGLFLSYKHWRQLFCFSHLGSTAFYSNIRGWVSVQSCSNERFS